MTRVTRGWKRTNTEGNWLWLSCVFWWKWANSLKTQYVYLIHLNWGGGLIAYSLTRKQTETVSVWVCAWAWAAGCECPGWGSSGRQFPHTLSASPHSAGEVCLPFHLTQRNCHFCDSGHWGPSHGHIHAHNTYFLRTSSDPYIFPQTLAPSPQVSYINIISLWISHTILGILDYQHSVCLCLPSTGHLYTCNSGNHKQPHWRMNCMPFLFIYDSCPQENQIKTWGSDLLTLSINSVPKTQYKVCIC